MTTPPRADQESAPPPMVISAGGSAGVFRGRLVIITGGGPPGTGIFVYSSAGALVGSWVSDAGTDPLDGDSVPQGLLSQNPAGTLQAVLNSASLTLTKLSGVAAPPLIVLADDTASTTDGTSIGSSGISTPNIVAVVPGNTAGLVETWHDLTTMSNGWSIGGHAAYTMLPDGWLGIAFKDLVPGTDTDATVIFSSANGLPAAYRPANTHRVVAYTNTLRVSGAAFEMGALEFETDGSIQCFGIAAAATRLDLFTAVPLNDS
jgi:hypothetical protein